MGLAVEKAIIQAGVLPRTEEYPAHARVSEELPRVLDIGHGQEI
jgi:hypothetical protein